MNALQWSSAGGRISASHLHDHLHYRKPLDESVWLISWCNILDPVDSCDWVVHTRVHNEARVGPHSFPSTTAGQWHAVYRLL